MYLIGRISQWQQNDPEGKTRLVIETIISKLYETTDYRLFSFKDRLLRQGVTYVLNPTVHAWALTGPS